MAKSIGNNKNGLRTHHPYRGINPAQLNKEQPSIDGFTKKTKDQINIFAQGYMSFLSKIRIAPDVTNEVIEIVKNSPSSNKKNYLETNEDRTAFGLVAFGKRPVNEGVRILYSHTDSPCLRAKINPAFIEWDPELSHVKLGTLFDVFGYGGIMPHNWKSRVLGVRGWAYIKGKRLEISTKMLSSERNVHTDWSYAEGKSLGEAHSEESLKLNTGHQNIEALLKDLKFKGLEDFARAAIFIVPREPAETLGNYINGYGHDARSGIYTAIRSVIDQKNLEYTTLVFGFDKEEVGSKGSGGADSIFFERVFDQMLIESGIVKSHNQITDSLRREIYSSSLAINTDVDVGSSEKEFDEGNSSVIDTRNVGRLGCGVFLNSTDGTYGDQVSPILVDHVMEGLKNIVFHTVGSPVKADLSSTFGTMNEYTARRGIPTINLGTPTCGLHSPVETIHMGDLYCLYQACKQVPQRLFEDKIIRKYF